MVYNTLSDVPYDCKTYVVGHDGFVNETDLLEKIKSYELYPNMGKWFHNQWISDYSVCQSYCLNEQCKEFKIKTEVIIILREMSNTDVIVDCGWKGRDKTVYYYEQTGDVVVCIEAGSHSCFDSSDRLKFCKQFNSSPLNEIAKIILEENNRIAGNVNPNSNHNYANEQMHEAKINALINNS